MDIVLVIMPTLFGIVSVICYTSRQVYKDDYKLKSEEQNLKFLADSNPPSPLTEEFEKEVLKLINRENLYQRRLNR